MLYANFVYTIRVLMPDTQKPLKLKRRRGFRKKRYIIPLIVLILLMLFRMFLPIWVRHHTNNILSEIPGYVGNVEDIDIEIFRGGYSINGMSFRKTTSQSKIPFIKIPRIEISVDWESVSEGKIASKIKLHNPEINWVLEDWKDTSRNTKTENWKKAWTDLAYLDINLIEIHQGKIEFVEFSKNPPINLGVAQLELKAENLQTVIEKERILPSPIFASGITKGQGKFSLEGNMNLKKKIPEMDLSFSLENADASILNNFTGHYGNFSFQKGKLNIYGEADLTNANFKGYIKPIFVDTALKNNQIDFSEDLWEGFELFFNDLLKHQGTSPLTTKISVETKLDDTEIGPWSAIITSLKKNWIQTFQQKAAAENVVEKPKLSKEAKRKLQQEENARRKKELRPKKG